MSIEGIPDGWELVKFGVPKVGDWFISPQGKPDRANSEFATLWPIIRKIEKPKRYRPFANAAEFEPHRDRWIKRGDISDTEETLPSGCFRVVSYNDHHFWTVDGRTTNYYEAFEDGKKFEDGTPFGVEVTDD